MHVKKLAVPLINDKILQQAQHVYIATAGISSEAFDFIRTRLAPKCKIDIVTGLDSLTSPDVLKKIWRHYQDRITLRIYTRNTFKANVYIFELPFRKNIAFYGSGALTMEGIKDHEEIFHKTVDPKEIEGLLSWYTSYFEFGETLTEAVATNYEDTYHKQRQRVIQNRTDNNTFKTLFTGGFNWDGIKFKTQFFKKEHYLPFLPAKTDLDDDATTADRQNVVNRLLELSKSVQQLPQRSQLLKSASVNTTTIHAAQCYDHHLRSVALVFGEQALQPRFEISVVGCSVQISMNIGEGATIRESLKNNLVDPKYRTEFFKVMSTLGLLYWIDVAGERKACGSFKTEEEVVASLNSDQYRYYSWGVGRDFSHGDPLISQEQIAQCVSDCFAALEPLFTIILKEKIVFA